MKKSYMHWLDLFMLGLAIAIFVMAIISMTGNYLSFRYWLINLVSQCPCSSI